MSAYFMTGIGTGVGKTFASCCLRQSNPSLELRKPVISGIAQAEDASSDTAHLLAAMGRKLAVESVNSISPWRFTAPLSPHLAAAQEGRQIDPQALIAYCREQMAAHPDLLIEGVGGLMVPITAEWLVIDWIEALGIPVILISSSYLGGINHSLLSLEALARRKIALHAVIISEAEAQCDAGLVDTAHSLLPFLPAGAALSTLPRQQENSLSAWKKASGLLSLAL